MLKAIGCAALMFLVSATPNDGIVREGVGERRAALDAMELTPLDPKVWDTLDNWTNSDALSAENTKGNVVLFYTWSSWYPTSVNRGMAIAKRLHDRHASEGLKVVGVHHPQGFEDADDVLSKRRVDFPIARDATGKFREMMRVDQDPDFYVIDRAGRVRFADIDASSVPTVVEQLLDETTQDAERLLDRMAADEAERRRLAQRTRSINAGTSLDNLPEVTLPEIPAAEYAAAKWPAIPEVRSRSTARSRGASNAGPGKVTLPSDGFFPARPRTNGKVIVLYFWNPGERETYENIMPLMDQLQVAQKEDVVVVGVATRLTSSNARTRRSSSRDNTSDLESFTSFLETVDLDHALLPDFARGLLNAARTSGSTRDGYAVIASTDGVVRWRGQADLKTMRPVLDQIIRVDPGVAARRVAEEALLRGAAQSSNQPNADGANGDD